jgi:transglutaminase/protease-like cytokinesis protein 3
LPLNATNLNKSYVSANSNIASVSSTGKVTAVAPGNTSVTVTSVGSGKTSVAVVTVTQPVVSVNLPVQNLSILVGIKYSLAGSVSPSNATNQKINYSSSNNSIATIDANGLVTGVSVGTAIITATSADGSKTATCNLAVTQSSVSNNSDWATINPIAQKTTGSARTLKVYNNQSTIYMLINGSGLNAKSQFYIDTDNNPNTGLKTMWLTSGIDYLIENNNLYRYTGSNNNWSFRKVSSVSLTKRDSLIGVSVALSKMNLSVGSVIHVGFLGNDSSSNILPVKSLQLPSYTLTNSTNTISF